MKSFVRLLTHILADCGMRCGVDPTRDIDRVTRRVEDEGFGFLAMTLPALCQVIERSLDEGQWQRNLCSAFEHRLGLPKFLRGFLLLVFDETTGTLRTEPSHEAIICLRQICNLFKKVRTQCSDEREMAAVAAYRACEDDLVLLDRESAAYKKTVEVGRLIFSDLLHDVDWGDVLPLVTPRHGPGATADRVAGNRKFLHKTWTKRLNDAGFVFEEFGLASPMNFGLDETPDPVVLEPNEERPVRVIFVPKTQKSPRVIAMEPVCMQYAQQALMQFLVRRLETSPLTKNHIWFRSCEAHHQACRVSSHDRRLATLDLSEASDRVSSAMVYDMLETVPLFRDLVFACRSTRAELPDGGILVLRKFASMGSALCFPIEAIAFFCAMVARRAIELGVPVVVRERRFKDRRLHRDLLVFGDDLIVTSQEAPLVCEFFAELKFRVGLAKSFWKGSFRESCGEDYYDGTRVTPVYCREFLPQTRRDVNELVSAVSLGNQLYKAGYWGSARYVRGHVEDILGELPHVQSESGSLGWQSFQNRRTIQRWNGTLHRFEYRGVRLRPSYESCSLSGDPALLKSLLVLNSRTESDDGSILRSITPSDAHHLERSVRRGALALKRHWTGY